MLDYKFIYIYIKRIQHYRTWMMMELSALINVCRSAVIRINFDFPSTIDAIVQGCTKAWLQVAATTRFSTVVHHICVSSVWNLLRVSLLVARILSLLLEW